MRLQNVVTLRTVFEGRITESGFTTKITPGEPVCVVAQVAGGVLLAGGESLPFKLTGKNPSR